MPVGFVRRIFAVVSQSSASNVQVLIPTARNCRYGSTSLMFSVLLLGMALPMNVEAQTAHFNYAQVTLGGGFNLPQAVAVDGSGNVFVADTNHNTPGPFYRSERNHRTFRLQMQPLS